MTCSRTHKVYDRAGNWTHLSRGPVQCLTHKSILFLKNDVLFFSILFQFLYCKHHSSITALMISMTDYIYNTRRFDFYASPTVFVRFIASPDSIFVNVTSCNYSICNYHHRTMHNSDSNDLKFADGSMRIMFVSFISFTWRCQLNFRAWMTFSCPIITMTHRGIGVFLVFSLLFTF